METRVFGVWLPSPSSCSLCRLLEPSKSGLAFGLGWEGLREELTRIRAKEQTAVEGILAPGKSLLCRDL